MTNVTIHYLLDEDGRKDSLVKGGNGQEHQVLRGEVELTEERLAYLNVREDGQLVVGGGWALSSALREVLGVTYSAYQSCYYSTPEELLAGLGAQAAQKKTEEEVEAAERKARREHEAAENMVRQAKMRAKIEAEGPAAGIDIFENVRYSVPEDLVEAVKAEISTRSERRRLADEAAREAKLQAEQSRKEHLWAHIREHGTDEQRERLDVGMLPHDEAVESLRERLFAPVDARPLYRRIEDKDVCDEGQKVTYKTIELDEATADQWTALKAIKAQVPEGSELTIREHRAFCECEGHSKVVRYGILVKITDGPITLSREYAV